MVEQRHFFSETGKTLKTASDLLLEPVRQRSSEIGRVILRHALAKLRVAKARRSGRLLLGS